MAIKLLTVNDIYNIREAKYLVDTEAEKDEIPEQDKVQGTQVLVIEGSKRYRMNSAGEWVEMIQNGGGSSGSSLPPVTSEDNGDLLGVSDGAWSKVDPPYRVTEQIEAIIPEQTVTTEIVEENTPPGAFLTSTGKYAFSDGASSLVGKTVKVSYNNTDYEVEVVGHALGIIIGDFDGQTPPSFQRYPFLITWDTEWLLSTENPTTATVKVEVVGKNIIPADDFTSAVKSVGGTIIVNGVYNRETYQTTLDKTAGEIRAAIESGRNIVIRTGDIPANYCPAIFSFNVVTGETYIFQITSAYNAETYHADTEADYPATSGK